MASGHAGASMLSGSHSDAARDDSQQTSGNEHTGIVVTMEPAPRDLADKQLGVTDLQPMYSYEQPHFSEMTIPVSVACVK